MDIKKEGSKNQLWKTFRISVISYPDLGIKDKYQFYMLGMITLKSTSISIMSHQKKGTKLLVMPRKIANAFGNCTSWKSIKIPFKSSIVSCKGTTIYKEFAIVTDKSYACN